MRYIDDFEITSIGQLYKLDKVLDRHPEYTPRDRDVIRRKVRAGLENGYVVSFRTWW